MVAPVFPLTEELRRVAETHLGWVYTIVARHMALFPGHGVRRDRALERQRVLAQAGALALVEVLPRYDARRGSVTTWVTPFIVAAVRQADAREFGSVAALSKRASVAARTAVHVDLEDAVALTDAGLEPVDRRIDGASLAARLVPELERRTREVLWDKQAHPQLKKLGVGPASVPRAVESFVNGLLHDRLEIEDAEAWGVSRTRVGQLRLPVRIAFNQWAAELRAEPEKKAGGEA